MTRKRVRSVRVGGRGGTLPAAHGRIPRSVQPAWGFRDLRVGEGCPVIDGGPACPRRLPP